MATKFVSELTETVYFSIEYALLELGKTVTTDIRRNLMRAGTGKWYYSKRYKRYGDYVASGGRGKWRSFFGAKEARSKFVSTRLGKGAMIRGFMHQASIPGAYPAPDTEALRQSIDFEIVKRGGGYKTLLITSNSPYARFMELGTHKVAARPFIRPSVYKYINLLGPSVAKAFRFKFASTLSSSVSLLGLGWNKK
jgi:hypothetical protein